MHHDRVDALTTFGRFACSSPSLPPLSIPGMAKEPLPPKQGPHAVPLQFPSASPGSSASRILKAEPPPVSDGRLQRSICILKDGPFFVAINAVTDWRV